MNLTESITAINDWIVNHQAFVVSIAIPTLTLLVTIANGRHMDRRESERQRSQRELARRIKLAEFRQLWINDLRNDLAALAAMTVNPAALSNDDVREVNVRQASVRLRLNLKEPTARELFEFMGQLQTTKQKDTGDYQSRFVNAGHDFLKAEWDRLKFEMEEIDRLEEAK